MTKPAEDRGPDFRSLVLAVVAQIPQGQLASYGQVAALAGFPQRPRQAVSYTHLTLPTILRV